MDRKEELRKRIGELKQEEGGLEAERDSRRTDPPQEVRPLGSPLDEPRPPEARDEPGAMGARERAEERLANRGPSRAADVKDEKPH